MNPRTKFFRGMAMLGVMALGVAACEDTNVVVPEPQTITAAPSSMTLNPGQTRQIVANLQGVEGGVEYLSDNQAVATVSNAGVVTAVDVGSATITVRSASVPTLATAVDVNVVAGEIPPSEGEASVTIASITRVNTNTPVNPANVSGIIDVTLAVQRGEADQLRVFLGDEEVESCRQVFGDASAAVAITAPNLQLAQNGANVVCSINTADYDVVNGQGEPVFANGEFPVRAELVANGTVLDAATSAALTLNNVDFTELQISTPNDAINPNTGLRWEGGAVTATAIPVIFTGASVASVRFETSNGAVRTDSDPSDGFSVTFPASGSGETVAGVEDEDFQVEATTVRTTGQPGPQGDSDEWLPEGVEEFRLDNRAPTAGTFTLDDTQADGWVNASYDFSEGHTGIADGGVEGVTVTYHVAPAEDFANPASLNILQRFQVSNTPAIEDLSELDETLTSDEYVVVARVTDALGNFTTVQISGADVNGTIGVDFSAPDIELQSGPANMTVTSDPDALADFVAAASDTLSGFGDEPWRLRVRVARPAGTACPIGSGTACNFETSATGVVDVPSTQGYQTVEIFVVDKAGNESEIITRLLLVDTEAPTVSNIQIPTTLTGGQVANFSAVAEDNLNLDAAHFYLGYNGLYLQFEPTKDLGSFGPAFDTERTANLTTTTPFIRAVQEAPGGTPSGTWVSADEAQWQVFDLARLSAIQTNAFSFSRPAGAANPFAGTWDVSVEATNTTICSPPACGTTPTSTNIVVSVEDTGTFDRPFSRVVLLRQVSADHWIPVGQTTSASVTDVGGVRTWTYSGVTYTADFASGTVNLRVAGITSDGDALLTDPVTITVQ